MLRLEIDGRWEPQDFIDILRAVEFVLLQAGATTLAPIRFPILAG